MPAIKAKYEIEKRITLEIAVVVVVEAAEWSAPASVGIAIVAEIVAAFGTAVVVVVAERPVVV